IARLLTERGVPTPKQRSAVWSSTMVLRILRNEKYCGDLLQKKTCTPDFLTHRSVPNHGQEQQLLLRDHHAAIVSRARFEQVQRELARRSAGRTRHSAQYWCSGKVRCGRCGRALLPRRSVHKDGSVHVRWTCRQCGGGSVRDETLRECVQQALQQAEADISGVVRRLCADCRAAERRLGNAARPEAARARQAWLLTQGWQAEQVYEEAVERILVLDGTIQVALFGRQSLYKLQRSVDT
ncbi:MAG: recombinase family protein, partial [Agathobaculum sp.]|uniref:recombinase family protein n=1 Tax=Agathobaculum sp. TaxID=2048138 RepID=UPI003D8EF1F5